MVGGKVRQRRVVLERVEAGPVTLAIEKSQQSRRRCFSRLLSLL
jgi:hypothetical protein